MLKLPLILALVGLAIPTAAHAQPTPRSSDDELEIDCEDDPTCLAAKFADALTSQPIAPSALRLSSLVNFAPGRVRVYSKDREKLSALATAWQQHVRWAKITIEGYASGPGNPDLARARADKIRGYLIRYGVDPGYIVAVGRDHPRQGTPDLRTTGGRVDLSISFCSRSSEDCPARTATAQR